jgi:hypothetical protein
MASEETKQKQSLALKGKPKGPMSEEEKLKRSVTQKGVAKVKTHGANVANAVLGNISINKDNTTRVNGAGGKENIAARINQIKVQIEILRQQVNHALMSDIHLVQNSLNNIFKTLYQNKELAHTCLEDIGHTIHTNWAPDFGIIELNTFSMPSEIDGLHISEESWTIEDMISIGKGLAQADEHTILQLLEKLKKRLSSEKSQIYFILIHTLFLILIIRIS